MAYIYEIIKDAYREANLIPITQVPSLDEQAEAVRLLNRFIKSIYGSEAGEKLSPVAVGTEGIRTPSAVDNQTYEGNDYAPLNARLMTNLSGATGVNLHPTPSDGSRIGVVDVSGTFATAPLTLYGNGRKIDGGISAILTTPSYQKEWFYRADLGEWLSVSDLTLSDVFPFPVEFEDLFVIGLALRINPRNGISLDEQSAMTYRRQLNLFRARYTQSIPTSSEDGLVRLTGTRSFIS